VWDSDLIRLTADKIGKYMRRGIPVSDVHRIAEERKAGSRCLGMHSGFSVQLLDGNGRDGARRLYRS
jgi:hypothetical protein